MQHHLSAMSLLRARRKDRHLDRKDDAARLRDRAMRLLALALRAREGGNVDVANDIALLASEVFNQADELERGADN